MNGRLRIIPRHQVGVETWDSFIGACDEAWLWHTWDLQEAFTTWAGEDEGFAVSSEGGSLLAAVPLRRLPLRVAKVITASDLDSLGGPALSTDLSAKQRAQVSEVIVRSLREIASRVRAVQVRLSLSPLAPAFVGDRSPAVNPLLSFGGENVVSQTWLLELTDSEAIWNGMEGRARTAVRKAEREEVTVREAGEADLDIYYELHCGTYARTGETPHPRAYFEAIWRDFIPRGRALVLIAEQGSTPVAAQSFAIFKGGAIYWTGAASEAGLRSGANNMLQWEALQRLLALDVRWYEAGEAFIKAGDEKLQGLSDFKRSTGGRLYPLYRMRFDTAGRSLRTAIYARETLRALRGKSTIR
jgi:hypothetical protein